MIRAFFLNWVGAFRDGWAAARALPLLVAAMMGIEFAQHAIELHLGFFSTDPAVHKAASVAPLRMVFGWPKMLLLYLAGFIALRWYVSRDAHEAIRPSARALRRYFWVVLFQLIPAAVIIYAGPIVAALGRSPDDIMTVRAVFGLGQQLLEPFLLLWYVNAAAGTHAYGPLASAKATGWLYLWALPLSLATRVPMGVLHGRLNMWPVGQAPLLQWTLLALDALVVVMLALVMPAIQVRIARYIAMRRDTALLDEDGLPPAPVDGPLQVA